MPLLASVSPFVPQGAGSIRPLRTLPTLDSRILRVTSESALD